MHEIHIGALSLEFFFLEYALAFNKWKVEEAVAQATIDEAMDSMQAAKELGQARWAQASDRRLALHHQKKPKNSASCEARRTNRLLCSHEANTWV